MKQIEFTTKSHDGIHLEGWYALPKKITRSSLIFCHGYMSNCRYAELADRYLPICEERGMAFAAFDFRNHGKSAAGPVGKIPIVNMPAATFGKAESWDLHAVLNWLAENTDAPWETDVMVSGDSLGGMAGQLLAMTDARISKAFLHHTPAWPMHAISVKTNPMVARATMALMASGYGFDVLGAGDVRQFPPTPAHRPRILHMMGTKDHYDINKTKEVYDYWYRDNPELAGGADLDNKKARKWFFPVEGAVHTDQSKGQNCVWHWGGYDETFKKFLDMK